MGWASGSDLAESVWKAVRIFVPVKERKTVAVSIVRAFEDHDCDTLDEAETLIADAALPEYRILDTAS
jgi:hypothetical protein